MSTMAFAILGGVFLAAASSLAGAAPERTVPFTVEAQEDVSARFPGAPRLHSFAWAQWDGKWIFIAGRSNGYHGPGGSDADFPKATANTRIWVVDPSGDGSAHTYSFRVGDLPASLGPVKDQWASSNTLFFQDGEVLYIAGGYGMNSAGSWVTFPLLSSVRLPELVDGVMHGRDSFSKTILHTESPLVQVTGGEMLKLDDGSFYVIGGHVFTGTYSDFEAANEKNSATASQVYTGEIRKLRISESSHGGLAVTLEKRYADAEFARRDLNATYRILPDGQSLGAATYGGVFTKDQLGFTKPIYWDATSQPTPDHGFEQKMSGYACAHLQLFDPDSRTMHTTFLGGISRWTWNYLTNRAELAPITGIQNQPVYFDGLTWIDHITTLTQTSTETFETVQTLTRLPAYLGANAVFLPVPGLTRIRGDADVFDMKALRGRRVLVGYLYGGIRAYPREFPYRDDSRSYRSGSVPTKASDMIISVYVTVPEK